MSKINYYSGEWDKPTIGTISLSLLVGVSTLALGISALAFHHFQAGPELLKSFPNPGSYFSIGGGVVSLMTFSALLGFTLKRQSHFESKAKQNETAQTLIKEFEAREKEKLKNAQKEFIGSYISTNNCKIPLIAILKKNRTFEFHLYSQRAENKYRNLADKLLANPRYTDVTNEYVN